MRGKKKTNDEFITEVYSLVGEEYIFLEDYKGNGAKIKCRHNVCGYKWHVKPYNFVTKGTRCPCYGNKRLTHEEYEEIIYKMVGDEYTLVELYKNVRTKIKVRHNICEYKYYARPDSFAAHKGCPQCSESKGEKTIRRYLDSKNIKYLSEYSFEDLKGVNDGLLRFDFAILNSNNELIFLIEYDGELHFDKYFDKQNFEDLQIHDKRKNQYCKDNNIPLIRIPYW